MSAEATSPGEQTNPALLTEWDGVLSKAKQLYAAADEYDRQASTLHVSGDIAALTNPGFSSALQMQASGQALGRVSTTIAGRIRAQADQLVALVKQTQAGSADAERALRRAMADLNKPG
jgi:hypothetical protein